MTSERVVEAVAHDDELVAAEPRHRVAVAQRATQPLPELHEDAVPGVVADAVVEHLEPVEVEKEHRGVAARLAALGDLAEPLHELVAVGQPGERVM